MSQDELAKKTGYSGKSMIARIERGDVDLPQSKIMLFAKALDISPGDIMGWDEDQKNGQQEGYYLDAETAALAQAAYEDPDLRILLKAKEDLSADDLNVVINMIKALQAKENND